MRTISVAVGLACCMLALPCVAQAHISLDAPRSRYYLSTNSQADQTKLKSGPCGVTGDKRTTNSALVTTFKPGETITVTWRETIQHPGHFRLAIDSDGQDFGLPDVTSPSGVTVLADGIADRGGANGLVYTQQITLPNIECSNCTLQLIQVMTTAAPPYAASDLYFNCADLVLKAAGGASGTGGAAALALGGGGGTALGTGGVTANGGVAPSSGGRTGNSGGSTASGGTMAGGATPTTGGSSGTGGTSTNGTSTNGGMANTGGVAMAGGSVGTGGANADVIGGAASFGGRSSEGLGSPAGMGTAPTSGNIDAGCSCQLFRRQPGWGGGLFALVALGALRRRRPTTNLTA